MREPDDITLRRATWIGFGRRPVTPAARAVVDDVLARILPHLGRKRALGEDGTASLKRDLGTVLGGVMVPGLSGVAVRAARRTSSPMWQGAALGNRRFWALADALTEAGLLGYREGVRTPDPGANSGDYGGVASALWPTPALVDLARGHGATAETRRADWEADATERAAPVAVSDAHLIACKALRGVPLGLTDAMRAEMEAMKGTLRGINAALAAADIRGAGRSVVLRRVFNHSLGFGGRFYGPDYINASAEERRRITINGEAVVEVDVSASQLTVLLGMSGATALPAGDLYALPGAPWSRDVTKQWFTQAMGSGNTNTAQWSKTADAEAKRFKAGIVGRAMRSRYASLDDLTALVPADLLATLPVEHHRWGAGQHIVRREAAIMERALEGLALFGFPALPVHDSLIVPRSAQRAATESLEEAFQALAGIKPRLKVSPVG